jgi:hypothetical protein
MDLDIAQEVEDYSLKEWVWWPRDRSSGHNPLGRNTLVLLRLDFSTIRKAHPTKSEDLLPKI